MIGRRGFLGILGATLAATRVKLDGKVVTPKAAEYGEPTLNGVVRIRVEEVSADGLTTRGVPPEEWNNRIGNSKGFICSGWISAERID